MFLASAVLTASGQHPGEPGLQPGMVIGTVTDMNDDIIPGANILLQSSLSGETRSSDLGRYGSYAFENLQPGCTWLPPRGKELLCSRTRLT